MKRVVFVFFVVFFFKNISSDVYSQLLNAKKNFSYPTKQQEVKKTSSDLIRQALNNKEISINEWMLYQAYALIYPSKLPHKFQSNTIENCGTWILSTIRSRWNYLDFTTKNSLMQIGFTYEGILSPPTGLDSIRENENFIVHYSIATGDTNAVNSTDNNRNGTPDYIDQVLDALSYTHRMEIDSMGYERPPFDTIIAPKTTQKYHIFIKKINHYGLTVGSKFYRDNPNTTSPEKSAWSSYMIIRNNMEGYGYEFSTEIEKVRCTIAHEFFHMVQFGNNACAQSWIMEATATWMMSQVYPNIYQNIEYLQNWFSKPGIPLNSNPSESGIPDNYETHWYGSWIFFQYLSEHYERDVIKYIWYFEVIDNDTIYKDKSIHSIDEALKIWNTSFAIEFDRFVIANYVRNIAPYNYKNQEKFSGFPESNFKLTFIESKVIKESDLRYSSSYYRIPVPCKSSVQNPTIIVKFTATIFGDPKPENLYIVKQQGKQTLDVNAIKEGVTYEINNPYNYSNITIIIPNHADEKVYYNLDIQINAPVIKLSSDSDVYYSNPQMNDQAIVWFGPFRKDTFISDMAKMYYYKKRDSYIEEISYLGIGGGNLARNTGNEVIWTILKGESIDTRYGVIFSYDNSFIKQITEKPLCVYPSYIKESIPRPIIDEDIVWFFGYKSGDENGLWTKRLLFEKLVYRIDPSYSYYQIDYPQGQIVPDGDAAMWRTQLGGTGKVKLWLYDGYRTRMIKEFTDSSTVPIDNYDFNNYYAVWREQSNYYDTNSPKIMLFDPYSSNIIQIAKKVCSVSPRTSKGSVIWLQEGKYSRTYDLLLWHSGVTDTLYTFKRPYNFCDFRIDNFGVAWNESYDLKGDWTRFSYYDFSTTKTTSIEVDLALTCLGDPPVPRDYNLNNGKIVFSGYKTSVLKTQIYYIDMKKLSNFVQVKTPLSSSDQKKVSIEQNYPNPFNSNTNIVFSISFPDYVRLNIYDVLGRKVNTLIDKKLEAGKHSVELNARNLSSGIYFYRLQVGKYSNVKKMIVLK
jgi:hypothetical protein